MKLDTLEPEFRAIVEKVIEEVSAATGLEWRATSCRRTIAEQDKLYAQGRTTKGQIVTKAKGGQSPHNFGLAVDCCPLTVDKEDFWWAAPAGYWDVYGAIAKEHGLVWGGDWKFLDLPHIETKDWKTTQAAWRRGEIQVA